MAAYRVRDSQVVEVESERQRWRLGRSDVSRTCLRLSECWLRLAWVVDATNQEKCLAETETNEACGRQDSVGAFDWPCQNGSRYDEREEDWSPSHGADCRPKYAANRDCVWPTD